MTVDPRDWSAWADSCADGFEAALRSVRSVVEHPIPASRPAPDDGRDDTGWARCGNLEFRLEDAR